MKGSTHVLIGASGSVPLLLATGSTPAQTALLTAVCVGASLGPDIDHPSSTVTRSTGRFLHEAAQGMSRAAREVTATHRDKYVFRRAAGRGMDPDHRALTHTVLFGVGMSGVAYAVAHLPWGAAGLAALCVLACRNLVRGRWRFMVMGASLAVLLLGHGLLDDPQRVGLAFLAGWLSHLVADGCTTAGVPLLWPLRIKERRWWRVRILGSWLKSGESKEMAAAAGVVLLMNIPYLMTL